MTPGGEVSTFAGRSRVAWRADGTGTEARFDRPHAIAIDAEDNLYVTEAGTVIRKITPAAVVTTLVGGGQAGPADVHLNNPWLVTATGAAIYVFDRNQDQKPGIAQDHPARSGEQAGRSRFELIPRERR